MFGCPDCWDNPCTCPESVRVERRGRLAEQRDEEKRRFEAMTPDQRAKAITMRVLIDVDIPDHTEVAEAGRRMMSAAIGQHDEQMAELLSLCEKGKP
jgi:hypothetical protein